MHRSQRSNRYRTFLGLVLVAALLAATVAPSALMQGTRQSQGNVSGQRQVGQRTPMRINHLPVIIAQPGRPLVTTKKRPPVPYKPFELRDPQDASKPISPTAVLTLPNGHRMTAGDYYTKLNKFEAQLTAQGYSLRDPSDKPQALADAALPRSVVQRQQTALNLLHHTVAQGAGLTAHTKALATHLEAHYRDRPSRAASAPIAGVPNFNSAATQKSLEQNVAAIAAENLASQQALLDFAKNEANGQHPTTPRPPSSDTYVKPAEVGFPDTYAAPFSAQAPPLGDHASFSPYFRTNSSLSAGGYNASVRAGVWVFGQDLATLTLQSNVVVKSAGMTANTDLSVFGTSVGSWNYDSGGTKLGDIDETIDSSSGDPRYPPVTYTFGTEVQYPFVVVFVPVTVTLSINGAAALAYHAHFKPKDKDISVRLIPSITVTATATAVIDLEIAGAGFYGSLDPLIHDEVVFDLDTLTRSYSCYNDFNALAGEFGLYAFIYLPRFGLPPWKKHEYKWPVISTGSAFQTSGLIGESTW